MYKFRSLSLITLSSLSLIFTAQAGEVGKESAHDGFFNNMKNLCGEVFEGASTYPDDPDHDFAGKKLVADFADCSDAEIRIKFAVGEDHSRTWVITKSDKGLLLKHDHRNPDGTPDEVTNYGGWANQAGSAFQQYFEADKETAELIPEASTNVWMLSYDPESKVLTYDLKRHSEPRYQAQLTPKE
ncbi:hypothetical protein [Marinicella gelatinilytica]|uniref:hypothetical protein n=1 Tax=Marinicella gelatinilytica TaxID=2996017 RepID=UPI002260A708|nr:hypothetical protein [Marinicella gelatinilytica]MCX7545395.1 hypothetical protein [Marinicella gelatinilytica]